MFKNQSNRKKGNTNLIEDHFKENDSFFKTGTIEMTGQKLFQIKLDKLNEIAKLPGPNEQLRIVTQKAINSFDFILAVLANEDIEELIVAFYHIGKKVIQELHDIQATGKIKTCFFLINDAVPKLTPDAYNLIKSLESENWNVVLENNHTKIILIKTAQNYYVIEGSGNLSINARIEQYVFDNYQKLFEFHKKWITEIKKENG